MPAVTHDELNVYKSAEARFEVAAQKLGLEEGIYRYLKYPSKEITVYVPVALDSGKAGSLHRLSRTAFCGSRTRQGRHSFRAGCFN